ncbi:hypothetical protein GCM10027399_22350 [Curvibacter fontanus]
MSTLSVKLPTATRERLSRVAEAEHTTAHAFMVSAIESALARTEGVAAMEQAALASRARLAHSGRVLDGQTFSDYLLKKAQGQTARRPAARVLPARKARP